MKPAILLMPCLLLAACGGDDGATFPDAGPHVDAGAEPPSLGEVFVTEAVDRGYDTVPESRSGSLYGVFRGSAYPTWHQEVANDGTCRLLKYVPAHCDDTCEGVCTGPDVCEPFPSQIDVGTLTVSGLAGGPVSMQASESGHWYFPAGASPAELFADDATIVASATGSAAGAGGIPAFQVSTRATPRLESDIQGFQITLHDDQGFVVHWTAAADADARVRLTLNANNQGHGAPYEAIILCETFDDARQIRVPASMIAAFPATEDWSACAGSDCPRSSLRRFTRAFASVPGGGIRLDVGSQVGLGVVHHHP